MPNQTPSAEQGIRNACPKEVCTCGYYDIVHDSEGNSIDVFIQKFPGLKLDRTQERDIGMRIKNLTTLDQFMQLREFLRTEYGITFLIQSNGRTKVDSSGGFCEKTRKRIQARFLETFTSNQQLVFDILDRNSLFSNASDERE